MRQASDPRRAVPGIVRGGAPVSDFYSDSVIASFGTKSKDTDDQNLQGSLERSAEWEEEVASFLAQHLGPTYQALFRSHIGTLDRPVPKLADDEHSEAWVMVDRRLQVLARIIEEVGKDIIGA